MVASFITAAADSDRASLVLVLTPLSDDVLPRGFSNGFFKLPVLLAPVGAGDDAVGARRRLAEFGAGIGSLLFTGVVTFGADDDEDKLAALVLVIVLPDEIRGAASLLCIATGRGGRRPDDAGGRCGVVVVAEEDVEDVFVDAVDETEVVEVGVVAIGVDDSDFCSTGSAVGGEERDREIVC